MAPVRRTPDETIRRVRLGDVKRVMRDRYGRELPDDDAGREDLGELLALSLPKNCMNVVETWAPWMPDTEAEMFINSIVRADTDTSPKALGKRLRLTNAEREHLGVWQILPCDLTKEELAQQKRAKKRARDQARRRQSGAVPRENSVMRRKPWVPESVSRATWYRNLPKANAETSSRSHQKAGETNTRQEQTPSETNSRSINSLSRTRSCLSVYDRCTPSPQSKKTKTPSAPPSGGETPARAGVNAGDMDITMGEKVIEALKRFAPQKGELIINVGKIKKRLYRDEYGEPLVEDFTPKHPGSK
jgi:hypothetical protein